MLWNIRTIKVSNEGFSCVVLGRARGGGESLEKLVGELDAPFRIENKTLRTLARVSFVWFEKYQMLHKNVVAPYMVLNQHLS